VARGLRDRQPCRTSPSLQVATHQVRRQTRQLLAPRQAKGVELAVWSRVLVVVAGTPIDHAVHDRWPANYRSATVKAPQDLAGGCIECIHDTRLGSGIDHSIGDT